MKHRHKWKLEYVNSTIGIGLLWTCNCGECLEFDKKPNYKKATEYLLKKLYDKTRS